MPQRACLDRITEKSRRATGEADALTALPPGRGWDVFTGGLMFAPETRAEAARLQAALPGYDVVVTSHGHGWRFEAVRCSGGPQAGPWCVISSDLAELWRELAPWIRPAGSRIVPARTP